MSLLDELDSLDMVQPEAEGKNEKNLPQKVPNSKAKNKKSQQNQGFVGDLYFSVRLRRLAARDFCLKVGLGWVFSCGA